MMADAADRPVEFNSILLVDLVELQAAEAAEPIERAFAANRIDVAMVGNWERVRQELGVVGLGLSMPKNPLNSLGFLTDVRPELGLWKRAGSDARSTPGRAHRPQRPLPLRQRQKVQKMLRKPGAARVTKAAC
jgi:hypothetical protein